MKPLEKLTFREVILTIENLIDDLSGEITLEEALQIVTAEMKSSRSTPSSYYMEMVPLDPRHSQTSIFQALKLMEGSE